MTTTLHDDLAFLAPLLGEWTGSGHGTYPTIEPFDYIETLRFASTGKPFISYAQHTRRAADGVALHAETGYLRLSGATSVELVIAQPTGIVEVDEGALERRPGGILRLDLRSTVVGLTSSAREVREVERSYELDDSVPVLQTRLSMAAVGNPLQHHLASELHRV